MARLVKNWTAERVEDSEVAPHRYLWSGAILADGSEAKDLDDCTSTKERRANVPYKDGEVLYVDLGGDSAVKARIVSSFWGFTPHGDRREYYQVQTETKDGLWSKLWNRVHPGQIQRGYQKAGIATDIPA